MFFVLFLAFAFVSVFRCFFWSLFALRVCAPRGWPYMSMAKLDCHEATKTKHPTRPTRAEPPAPGAAPKLPADGLRLRSRAS